MNIPKGSIRDGVIADALDAIPEGVAPDLTRALSFFEWRDYGGYHVIGSTNQDFLVRCSTKEWGSMIAREVSALLDQALEHRMLIAEAFKCGKTPSSSWLLVTIYYWCVFLALAWLRLNGKVVTYLPTEEIDRLKFMYNRSASKSPRNGTFLVTITDRIGAKSDLRYRRLRANNFHEGLWEAFYNDLDGRIAFEGASPASWETRLYPALAFRSAVDKTGWLSKLRNVINYRVGFAYDAVGGKQIPELLSALTTVKSVSIENIIVELEKTQDAAAARSVVERPSEHGRMMTFFGVLMTYLIEDVAEEVWSTRGLDPNWGKRRARFAQSFGEKLPALWPM